MHVAGKSFERVMKLGEVAGQPFACGDGQHVNIFISSGLSPQAIIQPCWI